MSVWQSAALLISEASISVPKSMWGAINWFKVSFSVLCLPLLDYNHKEVNIACGK